MNHNLKSYNHNKTILHFQMSVTLAVLCSDDCVHTEAVFLSCAPVNQIAKVHSVSIVQLDLCSKKKQHKKKNHALFFVDDISGESG